MDSNDTQQLLDTIKRHEGYRRTPYKCTAGKISVGYGRNLQAVGVSEDEAELLLLGDLTTAQAACMALFPFWDALNGVRQAALINMAFNLGGRGLGKFKKMKAALEAEEWAEAADQALDSKWARQVKGRANEIAAALRTGQWPA